MAHRILTNAATQDKILEVSRRMSEVVGSTLGPRGRLVMIQTEVSPITTKDGITVAKNVIFEGADETVRRIITAASRKTVELAGDGTTSTIVILDAILRDSIAALRMKGGVDFSTLRDSFEEARKKVKQEIVEITQKADEKKMEAAARSRPLATSTGA